MSGYLLWSLAERTQLDYCVKQRMLVIVICRTYFHQEAENCHAELLTFFHKLISAKNLACKCNVFCY